MPAFNDLKKNKLKGSIVLLAHETNETFNLLVVLYLSRRRKITISISITSIGSDLAWNQPFELNVLFYFKSTILFNTPSNRRKLFWTVNVNI